VRDILVELSHTIGVFSREGDRVVLHRVRLAGKQIPIVRSVDSNLFRHNAYYLLGAPLRASTPWHRDALGCIPSCTPLPISVRGVSDGTFAIRRLRRVVQSSAGLNLSASSRIWTHSWAPGQSGRQRQGPGKLRPHHLSDGVLKRRTHAD